MTTTEKLVGITAQHNEIVKRVGNGSLDTDLVRKALQDIIEGKFLEKTSAPIATYGVPSWYISPSAQLERVKRLNVERQWGFSESDFPSVPEDFRPRTDTEVLLLVVYLPKRGKQSGPQRTFDELWQLTEAPNGYTKWRWEELKSDSEHLRLAPGYDHIPGIRWVAFDPNAYRGKSPKTALQSLSGDTRLAGTEVLMAALLFPGWASSWNGTDSPCPNLSGLQFYWNTDWSDVPCLSRWDDYRQLGLSANWADNADSGWASPSVRKC